MLYETVVKAILSKSQMMLFLILLADFTSKRMFGNSLVDHGGVFLLFYLLKYLNCIVCYGIYFLATSFLKYEVLLFTTSS